MLSLQRVLVGSLFLLADFNKSELPKHKMFNKVAIVSQPGIFTLAQFCLLFLIFLLPACQPDMENKEEQEKVFYDVSGFIEKQVLVLNALKPSVSKTTEMGALKNEISTREIDWKKELELFAQADINKPSFKQSYSVRRPDAGTYIYTSREGDRLPIRQLTVTVDEQNQPVTILASILTENKLYSSAKNISLACVKKGTEVRIASYRIQGFQKLVLMDKKPFQVKAIIQY